MSLTWAQEHHPACPRGCGNLADECDPRLDRQAVRLIDPEWDEYDADLDAPLPCRWLGRTPCREEATHHGFCDAHAGTL